MRRPGWIVGGGEARVNPLAIVGPQKRRRERDLRCHPIRVCSIILRANLGSQRGDVGTRWAKSGFDQEPSGLLLIRGWCVEFVLCDLEGATLATEVMVKARSWSCMRKALL